MFGIFVIHLMMYSGPMLIQETCEHRLSWDILVDKKMWPYTKLYICIRMVILSSKLKSPSTIPNFASLVPFYPDLVYLLMLYYIRPLACSARQLANK